MNRIYVNIFLPLALSVAVGAMAAWWIAKTLVADTLQAQFEQQLGRTANLLAQTRLPLSPEILRRLGELLGAELLLLPSSGEDPGSDDHSRRAQARRVLEDWRTGEPRRGAHRDYGLALAPIAPGLSGDARAIAAIAPLTEVDDASRQVALQLGGLALAGTLLVAWAAHWVARRMTRPLSELESQARRLSEGRLAARSAVSGPRELASLGGALNRMADQIQAYQQAVAERSRLAALGELAARVAHEIRNPLTAIKLHGELLAESAAGDADRRALATVLNEVRRLELVVANTLSLGRPGTGVLADADLNALVASVADLLRPQLAHRRIELECRLAPLAPAPLDGDRIKQVLLNLASNAADALPDGGRIRITTGPGADGAGLLLTVEDSGPGLARAEATVGSGSDKPHGLGLGLRICREIAAEHGGRLSAETSAALGGARFVLSLPGGGKAADSAEVASSR